MIRSLLFLTLLPVTAMAGDYVTDAFGILPADAQAPRTDWSGLREDGGVPPLDPDRVLIVLGPKSMVAGKDPGHNVALVLDRFGNLVADGTPTVLTIDGQEIEVPTIHGIADHLFMPEPIARQIVAGAMAGDRQSPRAMVRVVPDIGSIAPTALEVPTTVNAESFFEVATGTLRDRFGNEAEDGTALSVELTHPDGTRSQAVAMAAEGEAQALFLSRDFSGPTEVTATIAANETAGDGVLVLSPTALGKPEARVTALPSISSVRVTVGPFLTTDGFALTDGSKVSLFVTDDAGGVTVESGWIRDGYFTAQAVMTPGRALRDLAVESPLGRMELEPLEASADFQEIME